MKSLHITYSRGKSLQFLQFESMHNNCNIHKGNMNKLVVVTYRSHYYKKRGKMQRRGKSTGGIHWQHPPAAVSVGGCMGKSNGNQCFRGVVTDQVDDPKN